MDKNISSKVNDFVENDIKNLSAEKKAEIIKQMKKEERIPTFIYLGLTILFGVVFATCFAYFRFDIAPTTFALVFTILAAMFTIVSFFTVSKDEVLLKKYLKRAYKKNTNTFLEEKLLQCEEKSADFIAENKLEIAREFELKTRTVMKSKKPIVLLVDDTNKKFVFKIGDNKFSPIHKFADVLAVKVVENKKVEAVHTAGAVFAEAINGLNGFITDESTEIDYCSSMILQITLNSIKTEAIYIPYSLSSIEKDSITYKRLRENIEEATMLFEYIKRNAGNVSELEITGLKAEYEKEKLKSEIKDLKKKPVYCRYCGAKNDADATKCFNCGAIITGDTNK